MHFHAFFLCLKCAHYFPLRASFLENFSSFIFCFMYIITSGKTFLNKHVLRALLCTSIDSSLPFYFSDYHIILYISYVYFSVLLLDCEEFEGRDYISPMPNIHSIHHI